VPYGIRASRELITYPNSPGMPPSDFYFFKDSRKSLHSRRFLHENETRSVIDENYVDKVSE
jgi:hypothetical protein